MVVEQVCHESNRPQEQDSQSCRAYTNKQRDSTQQPHPAIHRKVA
jgi:hypothetical protein